MKEIASLKNIPVSRSQEKQPALDTDLSGNELSCYNHMLPWLAETSQTAKPKANRRRIKGPQRKSYKKINTYRKFSFEPIEPNFIILYIKKPLEGRLGHFKSYLVAKTKRAILFLMV